MMKNATLTVYFTFMALSGNVFGQLHVQPSSYIYVNDRTLFVNNGITLQNDSKVYLRDQSQLLQGDNLGNDNSGEGQLSVFQEGSTNNYQYNYWCSPIGNATPAMGNENFGITLLHMPADPTQSTPTLTTTSDDGSANPLTISESWIYKYIQSSVYSGWEQVGAATSLNAGEGFTMKGTSGTDAVTVLGVQNNPGSSQRYDFRGKPNNGDIAISVLPAQFTLTGNPYASAIDLSLFLTEAMDCTGIAYFWEQDKTSNTHLLQSYRGGYGCYSPVSRGGLGIYVPAVYYNYDAFGQQTGPGLGGNNVFERYFSPVGQGFMIEGTSGGTVVMMKNKYRVYVKEGGSNFSEFERNSGIENSYLPEIISVSGFDYTAVSKAPVPQIRFDILLDNQGRKQLVAAFDPAATDAEDHAMDAKSAGFDLPSDVYFLVNEAPFAIDVMAFDIHKKIPVGFKNTNEASYKMTVSDLIDLPEIQAIYLHDKYTDMYFDIWNDFHEMVLPGGTNLNQYEITFENNSILADEMTGIKNIDIIQDNKNQQLVIDNTALHSLKDCRIFDVSGKLSLEASFMNTEKSYSINTDTLSDGIYIIRLSNGDRRVFSKKIIIKH